MRNKSILVAGLVVLAVVLTTNAYAGDSTAWNDFWNGVGGFINNALPWNWGNWMGK